MVRLLWSVLKAAPALLRHVAGYAELAMLDLDQTRRDLGVRLLAAAIAGVSIFFLIVSACLLIVALTWDTPHRVSAIAWMGGAFLLAAIAAAVYGAKVARRQAPFLATVRRVWKEDRVILDQILSSGEDATHE